MQGQHIDIHRWDKRVLLILSPSSNSDVALKQLKELEMNEAGMKERNLVIYKISKEPSSALNSEMEDWIINPTLYKSYCDDQETFKIILIGLDGGIKHRKSAFLKAEDLFAIIDAMPMRKSEMKQKQ
jgi:hypothetical protein